MSQAVSGTRPVQSFLTWIPAEHFLSNSYCHFLLPGEMASWSPLPFWLPQERLPRPGQKGIQIYGLMRPPHGTPEMVEDVRKKAHCMTWSTVCIFYVASILWSCTRSMG